MTAAAQSISSSNRGAWMVLAAGVLWGTTGTAQAFAPAGATPLAIGAIRLLVGGTALLILALARRQLHPRGWPLWPTVMVLTGIALYQVCFFAAVARAGVAVGTIVAIGSAPMLAGVLGLVILGERPTLRWLFATLLAVAGCTLLVVAGSGGDSSTTGSTAHLDAIGVLLALGAGAAYALYTIASRQLLRVQPPDAVTAVAFFGGALLLCPLLFFVDLSWLVQPGGLLVALHLGIVTTALAYILYIRALLTVTSATAVTLALMEPLTAATLGVVVLGERLTVVAIIGIALLLAGLLILTIRNSARPVNTAS
jgi:drug/metabolite transporter, DME family